MKEMRHSQLKEASRLLNKPISKFAKELKKPGGTKQGVSHTAVIRVAQGYENTEWIREAIDRFIDEARKKYPEYYRKRERQLNE